MPFPHPAIRAAIEAAHRADTAECSICGNHFPVAEGVVLRGRFSCRAAVPSFDPVVRLENSDAVEPPRPERTPLGHRIWLKRELTRHPCGCLSFPSFADAWVIAACSAHRHVMPLAAGGGTNASEL